MMPGSKAFSTNGEDSLVPRKDARLSHLFGQRMGMSELDVLRLGDMYNCYHLVKPHTKNADLAMRLMNGEGYDHGQCRDTESTGFVSEAPPGDHMPSAAGDEGAESWEWQSPDNGDKSDTAGLQAPAMPGALRKRSCLQLAQEDFCDKPYYASVVRLRCPVSCFTCLPGFTTAAKEAAASNFAGTAFTCKDSGHTQIMFRNGTTATCAQLHQFCDHDSLGEHVKKVCSNTCGHCPCEDHAADYEPMFVESGKALACDDLKDKCSDPSVADKCRVTCGGCPWHEHVRRWTDLDAEQMANCVRRRRFGYCYTRRRGEPIRGDGAVEWGAPLDGDHAEIDDTDEQLREQIADMPVGDEKK